MALQEDWYENARRTTLQHGYSYESGNELYHWKYIDKIKTAAGKWRYIYEDTKDKIADKVDEVKTKVNEVKTKVSDTIEDWKDALDTKKNIYDVERHNYDEKIGKIADTQEWKDAVSKKGSEYVKVDKETGKVTYDIDQYLLNKKHPLLDAVNDLAAGREISVHKPTADTAVAAAKDYVDMFIGKIELVVGVAAVYLSEKFKYDTGVYDDEIEEVEKKVKDTVNTVATTSQTIQTTAKNANPSNIIDNIANSAEGRELINIGEQVVSAYLETGSSKKRARG